MKYQPVLRCVQCGRLWVCSDLADSVVKRGVHDQHLRLGADPTEAWFDNICHGPLRTEDRPDVIAAKLIGGEHAVDVMAKAEAGARGL
jgi:hypothetical protein